MSNFITLTKEEFEKILPEFNIIINELSKEFIYDIKTENPQVSVRVYSTVDIRTNKTRDIGKDAIRIVFWDSTNNRPIGKGKKILRVQKATTIQERIKNRIDDFMKAAKYQEIVSFQYCEAILSHEAVSWMDFAASLLEGLQKYGKLSDGQLAYVLGETNPKGKPTMEARVKKDDPNFLQNYLNNSVEEKEDGKSKETPKENEGEKTKSREEEKESNLGMGGENEKSTNTKIRTRRNSNNPNNYSATTAKNNNTPEVKTNNLTPTKEVEQLPWKNAVENLAPLFTPEIPTDNLIPTKEYLLHQYPFEFFNPIQTATIPHIKEDKNIVISANTSAGKTIAAELIMDYILKTNKILYMSPLKSLTQEKYTDWQQRYPDKNICILTGDYTLSKEKQKELSKADIILCTSEMVDSRTRRMQSEKNFWLMKIGLLIIDESHILSTNRGHAVETGIMRFTKLNPSARILFLSATMPNVTELGNWLTDLNEKQTTIIYSTWRPVKLQFHHKEYQLVFNKWGREDYWPTQNNKRGLAVDLAISKPKEKFLIFCHDKATGRDIVKRLKKVGEEAIFHNADLDLKERLEVEAKFQDRENGIRILVSTSTLAYGRNLPARNVIVVGIYRGIQEVDELDIIQMAGRAGRLGIDDEGHVYLIIPEGTTEAWKETFENPRPVTSVLNDHNILAFHTLAEINNKVITTTTEMLQWYSRSLAFKQGIRPFTIEDANGLITDLENMEMIGVSGVKLFITDLGKISAWLYFSPYDIFSWYCNFDLLINGKRAAQNDPWSTHTKEINPIGIDDTTLSWAITDIPSKDFGYIPKDLQTECEEWKWLLKNRGIRASNAIPLTIAANCCLTGQEAKGLLGTLKRTLIFDIDRIIQALSLIDKMYTKWDKDSLWEILPARIKYGIPQEMVELTRLPGIGGKRAKRLWEKDIKTINDITSDKNKRNLAQILTPSLATKVRKAAKEMITGGK